MSFRSVNFPDHFLSFTQADGKLILHIEENARANEHIQKNKTFRIKTCTVDVPTSPDAERSYFTYDIYTAAPGQLGGHFRPPVAGRDMAQPDEAVGLLVKSCAAFEKRAASKTAR